MECTDRTKGFNAAIYIWNLKLYQQLNDMLEKPTNGSVDRFGIIEKPTPRSRESGKKLIWLDRINTSLIYRRSSVRPASLPRLLRGTESGCIIIGRKEMSIRRRIINASQGRPARRYVGRYGLILLSLSISLALVFSLFCLSRCKVRSRAFFLLNGTSLHFPIDLNEVQTEAICVDCFLSYVPVIHLHVRT